jgi:hypothetical protein
MVVEMKRRPVRRREVEGAGLVFAQQRERKGQVYQYPDGAVPGFSVSHLSSLNSFRQLAKATIAVEH